MPGFLLAFTRLSGLAAYILSYIVILKGYATAGSSIKLLGIEIPFITDSVEMAYQKAIAAGASEIRAPAKKPWSQIVSYIRCPDGTLIELYTPVI